MIIRCTNNKELIMFGVFMLLALIVVASFALEAASALKSKGETCKDNNKNVLCVHGKQSNSDQQNDVPFELPFP